MSKDDPQVNEDGAVTDAEAEATETVEETVVQDEAEAEAVEAPNADDTVATEAEGEAPEVAADDGSEEAAQVDPMRVVEAVLMAADAPITAQKIAGIMGTCTGRDVKKHIEALNEQYDEWDVSFRIEQLAGGYQILTQPLYNTWLKKLLRVRAETKLTGAAMETLAIVAYKQPCTRADVEAVRGVAVGDGLNRLREMNMVKIVGRAEDLGRPILYGTTRRFLEVFGLGSLDDLPQVEALKPGGKAVAKSEAAKEAADEAEASNRDDDDDGAGAASNDAAGHDGTDEAVANEAESQVDGDGHDDAERRDDEAPSLALVNDDDDGSEEEPVAAKRKRRAANE